MTPPRFDFVRYLNAKRSVDDRALNRRTWAMLAEVLHAAHTRQPDKALRVLEIGAGSGAMIERAATWGLWPADARVHYTAVDGEGANVAAGRARVAALRAAGQLDGVQVEWVAGDLFAHVEHIVQQGERVDLLIAHAVLDLVDIRSTLPLLADVLKPDGLLYAPITFDGATIFEPPPDPPLDPALDRAIIDAYHASMDRRAGGSQSGRRLIGALSSSPWMLLAAGSSDWIVYANRVNQSDGSGRYPGDEAYFLHHILHFFDDALGSALPPAVDSQQLAHWIENRRAQVERGDLIFIAHQVDLLARALH